MPDDSREMFAVSILLTVQSPQGDELTADVFETVFGKFADTMHSGENSGGYTDTTIAGSSNRIVHVSLWVEARHDDWPTAFMTGYTALRCGRRSVKGQAWFTIESVTVEQPDYGEATDE